MLSTLHEQQHLAATAELEAPLAALEGRLAAFALALRQPDADTMDRAAGELHIALAAAVERFHRAARAGSIPRALRERLALAGAQVAAQREALARATASLDRAIDVLMPRSTVPAALYSSSGNAERHLPSGGLRA
jgi:hypothetical protein